MIITKLITHKSIYKCRVLDLIFFTSSVSLTVFPCHSYHSCVNHACVKFKFSDIYYAIKTINNEHKYALSNVFIYRNH